MIKIALCLDCPTLLNEIHESIHQYCNLNETHLEVKKYNNTGSLMREVQYQAFDIIFTNIPPSDLLHSIILEKIRKTLPDVIIAFVLPSPILIHVGECNLANIVFLTKPISYKKIKMLVSEIRNAELYSDQKSLLVKNEQGIFKIRCCDILFLERFNKSVFIHTNSDEIMSCKTMKEYECKLQELGFYRCHTSFIVNTEYIVDIHPNELKMINKKMIPISRYRRTGLIQVMMTHARTKTRMNAGISSAFQKQV